MKRVAINGTHFVINNSIFLSVKDIKKILNTSSLYQYDTYLFQMVLITCQTASFCSHFMACAGLVDGRT